MTSNEIGITILFGCIIGTLMYGGYLEWVFEEDYEALKLIYRNDLLNDKNINDFFVKDVIKLLERLDKNPKRLMRKNPEMHLFHSKLKQVISCRSKK